MRIGEAVASLGLVQDDGEIIIVRIKNKRAEHYRLDEVADKQVTNDLYLATGTYAAGKVSRYEGRVASNLVRINELPFDFDLADFTGIPKEDLWTMPDAALWPLIEALKEAVEQVFSLLRLPICRMDYTGYGLACFLRLPPHKPEAVPRIQQLHASIVDRINAIARTKLADPQVKDAGTRIMRLAGCLNTKGAIPRQSRTLYAVEGVVTEGQLLDAAGEPKTTPPQQMIPRAGATLDRATIEQLIEVVSPHWTLGQKHHLALAISGLLAKAFVSEEQTLAIVERLSAGDEKPWDRAKCVHTTYERVRSGLTVKGFYGLQDALPGELVDWLDGIAQRVRQANTPAITWGSGSGVSESPPPTTTAPRLDFTHEFVEPPDSAFHGWIGEYVDLMLPTTEAVPAFHLASALTTMGALIGRRIHVQYGEPLYPNLYSLLVGRSGKSRKDTAIKKSTNILTDTINQGSRLLNHEVEVAVDLGSAPKLIEMLSKKPNIMLYLTEFSRIMGNARRKGTETIIPTLMEAFDTPAVMQNNSIMNPIQAKFPFLSILAATQPDVLSGLMTADDMHSGFANRWLFFCGNLTTEPNDWPPSVDRARAHKLFMDFWDARNSYADGTGLLPEPEARARWREWYHEDFHRQSESAEEDAMRARHGVLIQKLACIYAVADRSKAIRVDDIDRGIQIVEWQWRHVQELMGTWGRTMDGQIEERIRQTLERHGAIKKRELQRLTSSRKWAATDFSKVFDSMVKNQTVVIDPLGMVDLGRD